MTESRIPSCRSSLKALLTLVCLCGGVIAGASTAGDFDPQTPAAFLPGGMLDVQLGSSWERSKKTPSLEHMACRRMGNVEMFDEVCFFKTSGASRVGGAAIHDGFIVRKGDQVVLIGTGIAIKNADDPLAESVMQSFEAQVHSAFQHTGDDVLFVNLPRKRMSAEEMAGYSQRAPVLLVQLEAQRTELAVLYGYLAPVNAFSAMTAE